MSKKGEAAQKHAKSVGPQKIPISEIDFLRFRISKLSDEILNLREQKIATDKENLMLRRQMLAIETQKIYEEIGVSLGDQIVQEGEGQFMVIRPLSPHPTKLSLLKNEIGSRDKKV